MARKPPPTRPDCDGETAARCPAAERAGRRAAALRENLRRRKRQQRLRRGGGGGSPGDGAGNGA